MASVRLHHPILKAPANGTLTYAVELLKKPMPIGHNRSCNSCSRMHEPVVHKYKTIHLRLDSNGDVFVADGILELLRTVPDMAGLKVLPGRNAPPQRIGAVEQPTSEIVLAGKTFYVPGRNKYKAGERMQKPFEPVANKIMEDIDRKLVAKMAEKRSTFIFGRKK